MTKEEITIHITNILVDKLNVDSIDIAPDKAFAADLGADSLDTVEIILELEKKFKIAIPDTEAEKILTVGEAIDYIDKVINA